MFKNKDIYEDISIMVLYTYKVQTIIEFLKTIIQFSLHSSFPHAIAIEASLVFLSMKRVLRKYELLHLEYLSRRKTLHVKGT